MSDQNKPRPSKCYPDAEHIYFLHDPEDRGVEFFKTKEDRDVEATKAIAGYLDDGWNEEVTSVCVGTVTGIATQVDLVKRPDDLDDEGVDGEGRWWDPDWSHICQYRMLPPGVADNSFYLQDSRCYVGNDVLWWAKDGGYTTDLSQAQVFTREDAQRQHNSRPSDIPWPCEYIAARTRPAVDVQYIKRAEAHASSGIELQTEPKRKPEPAHCHQCGGFISDEQRYTSGCPQCGADNRP